MARRKDHTREELKDLILGASWRIVGKNGFEGLTARAVAAEIGYVPGTIYNLFSSMDDLALHVNARTLGLLYETLNDQACADPGKDPVRNMKAMAGRYMDFAREHRPYWLMLFDARLPQERGERKWYREKVERLFTPLENLLQPFFTARQDKMRAMSARVLWAGVHGLCFLQETGKIQMVSGKATEASSMMECLIDNFAAGLRLTQTASAAGSRGRVPKED